VRGERGEGKKNAIFGSKIINNSNIFCNFAAILEINAY
jgi:hypothetical protein